MSLQTIKNSHQAEHFQRQVLDEPGENVTTLLSLPLYSFLAEYQ